TPLTRCTCSLYSPAVTSTVSPARAAAMAAAMPGYAVPAPTTRVSGFSTTGGATHMLRENQAPAAATARPAANHSARLIARLQDEPPRPGSPAAGAGN